MAPDQVKSLSLSYQSYHAVSVFAHPTSAGSITHRQCQCSASTRDAKGQRIGRKVRRWVGEVCVFSTHFSRTAKWEFKRQLCVGEMRVFFFQHFAREKEPLFYWLILVLNECMLADHRTLSRACTDCDGGNTAIAPKDNLPTVLFCTLLFPQHVLDRQGRPPAQPTK